MGKKKCHLIIPGAQKAGTTWMHNTLEFQNEFWCPPEKQEIHFFDRYYDVGYKEYEKIYKNTSNKKITVDVTPAYLCNPLIPSRIRAYNNVSKRRVKVVAMIRNPIDRAISAYKMKVKKGGYEEKLSEALKIDKTLIRKSKYSDALKKYIENMGTENLKVLITEEVFGCTKDKLRELRDFVGAEQEISNPYGSRRVNAASEGRSYRAVQGVSRMLRHAGAEKLVHWVKRSRWSNLLRTSSSNTRTPTVDERGIERLRNELISDARTVSEIIDRPDLMSIWSLD